MNLSMALKRKNRLVRELEDRKTLLQSNNVREGENELDYDADELRAEVGELMGSLVSLKTAISLANAPIQSKIYRISELKGLIKLYQSLETKHGTFQENAHRYSDEITTKKYTATIRRKQADVIIKGLQEEIDSLQDEIDAHNHDIKIEL